MRTTRSVPALTEPNAGTDPEAILERAAPGQRVRPAAPRWHWSHLRTGGGGIAGPTGAGAARDAELAQSMSDKARLVFRRGLQSAAAEQRWQTHQRRQWLLSRGQHVASDEEKRHQARIR
mgnify:CR=1 FL=1